MATYRVEWKASAFRELKRLDRQVVPRIFEAVDALHDSPFPVGVRKLQGSDCTYRIRVGDYRVIYDVFDLVLVVQIIRVRHRKDAYR